MDFDFSMAFNFIWSLLTTYGPNVLWWVVIGSGAGAFLGGVVGFLLFVSLRNRKIMSIKGRGTVWIPRIMGCVLTLTGLAAGLMMGAAQGVKSPMNEVVYDISVVVMHKGVEQGLNNTENPALIALREERLSVADAEQLLTDRVADLFSGIGLEDLACGASDTSEGDFSQLSCQIAQQMMDSTSDLGEEFVSEKLLEIESAGDNNGLVGARDIAVVLASYAAPFVSKNLINAKLNVLILLFFGGGGLTWSMFIALWTVWSHFDRKKINS